MWRPWRRMRRRDRLLRGRRVEVGRRNHEWGWTGNLLRSQNRGHLVAQRGPHLSEWEQGAGFLACWLEMPPLQGESPSSANSGFPQAGDGNEILTIERCTITRGPTIGFPYCAWRMGWCPAKLVLLIEAMSLFGFRNEQTFLLYYEL